MVPPVPAPISRIRRPGDLSAIRPMYSATLVLKLVPKAPRLLAIRVRAQPVQHSVGNDLLKIVKEVAFDHHLQRLNLLCEDPFQILSDAVHHLHCDIPRLGQNAVLSRRLDCCV